MEREEIKIKFANRLARELRNKGLISNTSSSGVQVTQMASAIDCSPQMVRKYVLGEAMPDYLAAIKMSNWLGVAPGWLIFGDEANVFNSDSNNQEQIKIEKDVLEYALENLIPLISSSKNQKEIISFIVSILFDASYISADTEKIKKIIDMAVNSAKHFSPTTEKFLRENSHGGNK